MKVKLINVRLSFPVIWKAEEFKAGDGKPRFDATFLVVPGSENDTAIEATILAVAKEEWKDKAEKLVASMRNNSNKFCYCDGDLKEYDGYAGMKYLATHSKVRPLIIDEFKNPLSEQDGKPYADCYVDAMVDIYAQSGENQGMRCSFTGLQFRAHGDAFSAGAPASLDDFDMIAEGADAPPV